MKPVLRWSANDLFPAVLNMSLTASVVILFVPAALLLRRAPKIFSYALWAVVLFRPLCPIFSKYLHQSCTRKGKSADSCPYA